MKRSCPFEELCQKYCYQSLAAPCVGLFGHQTVTKKTHEAAGFSLSLPLALLVITGSSAEPKWVKTRKTRGFLGYCPEAPKPEGPELED